MAVRVGLVLFMLTLAVVSVSASPSFSFDDDVANNFHVVSHQVEKTCNGSVGDCIGEEEEGMMGSESSRRVLVQQRYISYDAMKSNNVPCSRRGNSYYSCNQRQQANPYSRGCNVITNCARKL